MVIIKHIERYKSFYMNKMSICLYVYMSICLYVYMSCPSLTSHCRDRIERSTLQGEDRQVVLLGVQSPYALSVFQQDLFFTDWTTRSVYRAGKDDGSELTVLIQDLQYRPNAVHVFTPAKQELCSSPCLLFNGGCSHVCVAGDTLTLYHSASKGDTLTLYHAASKGDTLTLYHAASKRGQCGQNIFWPKFEIY